MVRDSQLRFRLDRSKSGAFGFSMAKTRFLANLRIARDNLPVEKTNNAA